MKSHTASSPKRKLTLKERRRRARLFIVYGALGVLVTVLIASAVGLRHPRVTIQTISVSPLQFSRSELVSTAVEELLLGSYFFLIPKNSGFFVPIKKIEDTIQKQFHSVQSITVERDGFSKLALTIEERVPDALWCDSFEETARCFIMDERGFIFAPRREERALRVFSGSISRDPMGETFLNGEFPRLREFLVTLSQVTKKTPKYIRVDEHGDVWVSLVEGGEVRFVLSDMSVALSDSIASVFASRRFTSGETLEYADFRFGNKVYVKFVGE